MSRLWMAREVEDCLATINASILWSGERLSRGSCSFRIINAFSYPWCDRSDMRCLSRSSVELVRLSLIGNVTKVGGSKKVGRGCKSMVAPRRPREEKSMLSSGGRRRRRSRGGECGMR